MIDFTIRRAGNEDAEMLARLAAKTFWDAYHGESKLENKYLKAYMDSAFDPVQIEKELSEDKTVFLLSETTAQQIGYAKLLIGSKRPELKTQKPMEISRIYLDQAFIGKGYGEKLLGECVAQANLNKCDAIWLSVWEHNKKAIRFYKNHGFRKVGEHPFDLASSMQTDFVMEKLLCLAEYKNPVCEVTSP